MVCAIGYLPAYLTIDDWTGGRRNEIRRWKNRVFVWIGVCRIKLGTFIESGHHGHYSHPPYYILILWRNRIDRYVGQELAFCTMPHTIFYSLTTYTYHIIYIYSVHCASGSPRRTYTAMVLLIATSNEKQTSHAHKRHTHTHTREMKCPQKWWLACYNFSFVILQFLFCTFQVCHRNLARLWISVVFFVMCFFSFFFVALFSFFFLSQAHILLSLYVLHVFYIFQLPTTRFFSSSFLLLHSVLLLRCLALLGFRS